MARILVIDNNVGDRIRIHHALEPAGHRVIEVSDGQIALDIAMDRPPDLIILDLVLLELDGFKVIRALREHGLTVPIIVQTRMARDTMRETCLKVGATAFLRKPVAPVRLTELVQELLAQAPLPILSSGDSA